MTTKTTCRRCGLRHRTPIVSAMAVYAGRAKLGWIEDHGSRKVLAFDTAGKLIGTYATRKEAIIAVETAVADRVRSA